MRFEGGSFDTDAAFGAMGVSIGTSDTANAAIDTMILPFVLIVEKDADGAPIGTQGGVTMTACLRCRLFGVAHRATHGAHSMAIQCVCLLRILFFLVSDFVVAKSAGDVRIAAGR
jgi:hypothetical protein